jgi:hypothetical protein
LIGGDGGMVENSISDSELLQFCLNSGMLDRTTTLNMFMENKVH